VILDGRGSQTMKELAQQLAVTPSTATRLCDRLVERHLITRVPHPEDRRVVCVELTPQGRRLVDRVMRRRRAEIDAVLVNMNVETQRRLARSLVEFTAAAGPIADHSWVLGWNGDLEDNRGE
jgi:DNA-binding MarR family transcriptional regulator